MEKKGIVEMCLLWVLLKDDSYGYQLIHTLSNIFSPLPERTVYAVLKRSLDEGYTEQYTNQISAGPPRKYYRITEKGKLHLDDCIKTWTKLVQSVESLGITKSKNRTI